MHACISDPRAGLINPRAYMRTRYNISRSGYRRSGGKVRPSTGIVACSSADSSRRSSGNPCNAHLASCQSDRPQARWIYLFRCASFSSILLGPCSRAARRKAWSASRSAPSASGMRLYDDRSPRSLSSFREQRRLHDGNRRSVAVANESL